MLSGLQRQRQHLLVENNRLTVGYIFMEMLSLPLRERCLGITSTCWRSGEAHGAPPRWKLWYLTHTEPGGGRRNTASILAWSIARGGWRSRWLTYWLIDWAERKQKRPWWLMVMRARAQRCCGWKWVRAARWGKGRAVCKSVKSAIITASAQKAISQLAEMVLIILTRSAPRHPAGSCTRTPGSAFEEEKKTQSSVCLCFLPNGRKTTTKKIIQKLTFFF